jgi:2-keto-4-pentenoate hydratase
MTPQTLLACHDQGRLWGAGLRSAGPADLAAAYRIALAVRALRVARGENPVGYKIGFTNRTIWQRYGVFAPIWGTVWDTSLTRCQGEGTVALAATCQPRLEPEIVFGISATPPADATLEQLFACVDWLAPGFEVVQSHAPEWKFSAAETVADGGLHARLLVGRRIALRNVADSGQALDERLANCGVRLMHDELLVEAGHGRNVLDGPLHALRHFVLEQQRCPGAPGLRAGDVVTTGTWTDAWPVQPGQGWRAEFDAPIGTLAIKLV